VHFAPLTSVRLDRAILVPSRRTGTALQLDHRAKAGVVALPVARVRGAGSSSNSISSRWMSTLRCSFTSTPGSRKSNGDTFAGH
jgi:hypothetical protein